MDKYVMHNCCVSCSLEFVKLLFNYKSRLPISDFSSHCTRDRILWIGGIAELPAVGSYPESPINSLINYLNLHEFLTLNRRFMIWTCGRQLDMTSRNLWTPIPPCIHETYIPGSIQVKTLPAEHQISRPNSILQRRARTKKW